MKPLFRIIAIPILCMFALLLMAGGLSPGYLVLPADNMFTIEHSITHVGEAALVVASVGRERQAPNGIANTPGAEEPRPQKAASETAHKAPALITIMADIPLSEVGWQV